MGRIPSVLQVRRRNVEPSSAPSPASGPSDFSGSTKDAAASSTSVSAAAVAAAAAGQRTFDKPELRRATRARRVIIGVACASYLLAVVFLLLVTLGNTHDAAVLRDIYFFKLDLADIIPQSAPNANLINSIARSIGLHDFYQVGLWDFCEGYNDQGVTGCSAPQSFYWFNPVEVLMDELLAGATIALPTEVITILDILRLASKIMFGFFLTGLVLAFLLMLASPVALRSRWWSLPLALLAALDGVLVFAAAVIATVISLAFKYAATSQSELNIRADVGVRMFAFMWIASGFAGLAFVLHASMGCCAASVRDVVTGRRTVRGGSSSNEKGGAVPGSAGSS